MKHYLDNRYRRIGITAFLVIAASILFYYGIFHMKTLISGIHTFLGIIAPIIYGIVIAYLLDPIVRFLERKFFYPLYRRSGKMPKSRGRKLIRWSSAILSLIFFLVVIFALLMMILPQVIRSIVNLINNFSGYADVVEGWINSFIQSGHEVNQDMLDMLDQLYVKAQEYLTTNILPQMQNMLVNVTSGIINFVQFIKNFLIGAIIALYMMVDKERFIAKGKMLCYAFLPGKVSDFLIRSMRLTNHMFGGFISGKIIDSAIIGVICYFGTSIMNMPYAMLISVFVGVTNFVPFFGPFIGAIPSIFLILLVDPIKCIYFMIFILLLQQFDGNILGPKILGDSTGLSSFMVIVAILVGGGLFGVPGMVIGVPVCSVIRTGVWKLAERRLRFREYPDSEASYMNIDRVDLETKRAVFMKGQSPEELKADEEKLDEESRLKRRNFFMIGWNAVMGVLKPVFRKLLWALDKAVSFIGHYVLVFFGKLKEYLPVLTGWVKKWGSSAWKRLRDRFFRS